MLAPAGATDAGVGRIEAETVRALDRARSLAHPAGQIQEFPNAKVGSEAASQAPPGLRGQRCGYEEASPLEVEGRIHAQDVLARTWRVAYSPADHSNDTGCTSLHTDHNVLQIDDKNMDEHRFLQSFSSHYGIQYSRPGNGISHYVHLERFARPGELLVGADSHSLWPARSGCSPSGLGVSTSPSPWWGTASLWSARRSWASSCAESCLAGCRRRT